MQSTVCKKCNRVVYLKHVDEEGYCCFCRALDKAEKKPGKKRLSEVFKDED